MASGAALTGLGFGTAWMMTGVLGLAPSVRISVAIALLAAALAIGRVLA